MKSATSTDPMQQVAEAWRDLISRGAQVGLDLLAAVGSMPMPRLPDVLRGMSPRGCAGSCSCDIPPPCWVPQELGEVKSHVCPGGTATLRIQVANCGATGRTIHFEATGSSAGVTLTPSTLTLGPLERGVAVASLGVPATAAGGEAREALIWVRGCQDHVLRWKVKVTDRGVDCCHQVDVEDCPDLIHHWYDHFYCQRPCPHPQRNP